MKIYTLLIITTLAASAASSQEFRINAYGNYVFDDKVESYYSSYNYFNATIRGGLLWGAGLEFRLHEYYGLELLYLRQDTKAPVHYYDINSVGDKNADVDVRINWAMASAVRSMSGNEKVDPYGGFMLGAAFISAKNPETQSSSSSTKFAWGMKLGTNIWLTERLGLKVQMQLLVASQAAGGSLYFGSGGSGVGVTAYSTMAQFSLGGGLAFRFGH
jgi:hypothetical protein